MSDFNVEWWPTDRPIPTRNGRRIPERLTDKVATSIKEFSLRHAMLVDKDNVVICGHS